MKDLNTLWRDGDPAASDKGLSPAQAEHMRRQILSAARQPDVLRTPWQQPLAVAAVIALTVAAGIIAGQRFPRDGEAPLSPGPEASSEDGRRQLQFSTPGGTRIIWVFDPEFSVKETVP
jgi:hypothetical protein